MGVGRFEPKFWDIFSVDYFGRGRPSDPSNFTQYCNFNPGPKTIRMPFPLSETKIISCFPSCI
jgi:hypothetical protein